MKYIKWLWENGLSSTMPIQRKGAKGRIRALDKRMVEEKLQTQM